MTPKIIKQGQIPEEQPRQCTCPNCKTVMEYLYKDREYESDCRGDQGSWYIKCGLCHKPIYLHSRSTIYTTIMDH